MTTITKLETPTTCLAIFLAIFAVAILARTDFGNPIISPDGKHYLRLADNIIQNGCYSSSPPIKGECIPTWSNQPPGYPIFLAALSMVGKSERLIVITQGLFYSIATLYALFSVLPFLRSKIAIFCAGLVLALSPFSMPWSYWVLTETLASAATLWVFSECLRSLSSGKFRLGPIALALSAATLMRWDLIWLFIPVGVVAFFLLTPWRAMREFAVTLLVVLIPFILLIVRAVLVGLPALPTDLHAPKNQIPPGILTFYSTMAVRENAVFLLWHVWDRQYSKLHASFEDTSFAAGVNQTILKKAIQNLSELPDGAPVPQDIDLIFARLTENFKQAHCLYWMQLPIIRSLWLWREGQFGNEYLKLYQWVLLALVVMAIPFFSIKSPEGAFFLGLSGFVLARTLFLACLAQLETRYLAPFFPVMELAAVLFLSRFLMGQIALLTNKSRQ